MEWLFLIGIIGVVLVLPVVLLVVVVGQHSRLHKLDRWAGQLSARLAQVQNELSGLRGRVAGAEPEVDPMPRPAAGGAQQGAATPSERDMLTGKHRVEQPPREAPVPPAVQPREPDTTTPPSPLQPANGRKVAPPPSHAATPSPHGENLERRIGTRVTVWVGAVALALAGGFLVKYTFDTGLLTEKVRVILGIVFGVTLLGSAEWIRSRSAGIAQGLAAAGIAVLFASLLAGVNLYHLISPAAGFVLLAATTAAAVGLSLRHGPFIAVLGMLGGFLTPWWISSDEPSPWTILLYLLLLQGGLLIVSRRLRWWPLAALTLLGGSVWGWTLVVGWYDTLGGSFPAGAFILGSIVAFVAAARTGAVAEDWDGPRVPDGLVWASAGSSLPLLVSLVRVGDFGVMEWTFLGILGAGCLVLGRIDDRLEGLPWVTALASAGTLLVWGFELAAPDEVRFAWTSAALGLLYAGGAYTALWGSARPDRWTILSSVAGVAYLLAAYAGLHDASMWLPWWLLTLLLAASFTLLALPVLRRRSTLLHGQTALTFQAVAVTVLVSLAAPMKLEHAWIGVAWALEIPALAWIMRRLRLPALEPAAWALAICVGVRLLLNPMVLDYPIGTGIVFNWLLYGYGIPLAAFAVGALSFHRLGRRGLALMLGTGSILFGFALLTLLVRQYHYPGDLAAPELGLVELGAYTVIWLIYALGLLAAHRGLESRRGLPEPAAESEAGGRDGTVLASRLFLVTSIICGAVALTQALLAQGLGSNPLLWAIPVGETFLFNRLLFVYGLPAVLALLLALGLKRSGQLLPARLAGSVALVLGFITLTFEVRQAFHGNLIQGVDTTNAEMYTYSLTWILFGTALLVAGILTRGAVLRYGSAAVMVLAVGKVFLVDTAHLRDLYRVFSLFGLGVSLMVLAYLYQRLVFKDERERSA